MSAPYPDCAMKGGVCSSFGICQRYGQCLEGVSPDFHHGYTQGYSKGVVSTHESANADAYKAGLQEGKKAGIEQGKHEGRAAEQKETPRRFLRMLEGIKDKAEEKANFLEELIEELQERYPSLSIHEPNR
jgi:hypothetical protein